MENAVKKVNFKCKSGFEIKKFGEQFKPPIRFDQKYFLCIFGDKSSCGETPFADLEGDERRVGQVARVFSVRLTCVFSVIFDVSVETNALIQNNTR